MKCFVFITLASAVSAQTALCNAPAPTGTYALSASTTSPNVVTPDAGLNGAWVVYNKLDTSTGAKAGARTAAAPPTCTTKADGTKFVFGDAVPTTCCTLGPAETDTKFFMRSNGPGGMCAAVP